MKLRLSMAMVALALVGCGKKDGAAPAPAPVEAVAAVNAPAAATDPAPATPTAVVPTEAKAEHNCAGHEHAQEANADPREKDCPFHDQAASAQADPANKPAEEAVGCGNKPLVEAAATAAGGLHFGKTFELTDKAPLGDVAKAAKDGEERTVRVTGTIDKVCQKKGCWMVVKDGDFEARVVMKDAAFTVPLDSTGKAAQVEGTLKVRVYTEAQAKHLAEDGGQDPNAVTGEKKEFLLMATAVEIGG